MASSREVIRRLQAEGWRIHRQRGSHVQLVHDGPPQRHATVPHPVADLPPGTLKSIERQAGLSLRPSK